MKKRKAVIGAGALLAAAAVGTAILMSNRQSMPDGVKAVRPFFAEKYLGKWYEVARMDFRHERNLSDVTAEYSLNMDGSIRVVNRGYNMVKNRWEEAVGRAKFVNSRYEGALKVSFFGPFYSGYNVVAIDDEYKYTLVVGRNLDYMWLLSREKTMPEDIKQAYLDKAAEIGFDVSQLVWTQHKWQ